MIGHGIAGSLITAAAGYWVLTTAGKEKSRVKTLGQWLGLLIIVVGVAGAACKFYSMTTGRSMNSAAMCPFAGRQAPPPGK